MNPYEPPQTELAKLDEPEKPSLWLVFTFGFPLLLFFVVMYLLS